MDGSLSSSVNELVFGFITSPNPTSQVIIVTTSSPSTIYYTITSDTFSVAPTVANHWYTYTSAPRNSKEKGIYVKAEEGEGITIHGWLTVNSPTYSTDGFLAFSTNSIDEAINYEYYSIPFNHSSLLLIVATENATNISFQSNSMMLDQFKTHQIDDIPRFSSEKVTSNKPISVISSKSCLDGEFYCDYLAEQILPTHLWGKKFLVASFLGIKAGESIRIIFSESSALLTVTCTDGFFQVVQRQGLDNWMDVLLDGINDRFCVIESNVSVCVVQFAQETDGESYMMTIPSVAQYGDRFVGFYTPNVLSFNFVTLYLTPEHYVPGLGVSVDGLPVQDWTAVRCSDGSTCGYIARPPLRRRYYHTVVHADPRARIGVSAYGYDTSRKSSYGYPVSLQIPSPRGELIIINLYATLCLILL